MKKKLDEVSTVYNISLQSPQYPQRDRLSQHLWRNPLVPLDQAIRATVGPRDVVIGDPTDFKTFNHPRDLKINPDNPPYIDAEYYDWGWDLDSNEPW